MEWSREEWGLETELLVQAILGAMVVLVRFQAIRGKGNLLQVGIARMTVGQRRVTSRGSAGQLEGKQ
jgi:hypothetical protein